jgi:hypothetical protein
LHHDRAGIRNGNVVANFQGSLVRLCIALPMVPACVAGLVGSSNRAPTGLRQRIASCLRRSLCPDAF